MAEPTDINKNKSTVSSMVDALRVELKELQSFKTVDPDVLGGKAGKSIPVPKKFTAEQTVAFMKQFPNMFPLANENAYFGIARALTSESPDLFDVASFDAYEEKFGKTMEMQEKGASASKNITTAKTPKAANQPVAEIDYKSKIQSGSITVREAFKAVLAKKLSPNNRTTIESILKAMPKEGIDLDANYFDTYLTKNFAEALDYTTNESGSHRYKEFGAFETAFNGLVSTSKRNEPYVRLSDAKNAPGIASTEFGLKGTQLRGKDPMRGTIFSEQLDKIYNDALGLSSTTEVDTKRGADVRKAIDPQARDYLIYEKYTGQRAESNIGPDGLKISDFNFFTDENGNTSVEVMSKRVGNKTRPEATYTGEFAEFLRNKVERAKGSLPADADFSKVNLFQTTPIAVTKLWDAAIRPELEKNFRDKLPEQKGGSHSTVRKILARQFVKEFKFPRDAVKAWMGHAGAGVNSAGDILDESYIGTVSDERIGEMTNTLIRNDALNSKAPNVNTMFVNRGAGFSQEVIFETPTKRVMGNTTNLLQSGAITQPASAAEKAAIDAAANRRASEDNIITEENRQRLSQIRSEASQSAPKVQPTGEDAPRAASLELEDDLKKNGFSFSELVDSLTKRTLQVGGAALLGTGLYEAARDPEGAGAAMARDLAIEGVGLAARVGAGIAGALPAMFDPSLGVQIQSQEDETRLLAQDKEINNQDPAGPYAGQDFIPAREVEETDEDMMARLATQDSGMIPEPDRVPQAAPAQDQGFLSR